MGDGKPALLSIGVIDGADVQSHQAVRQYLASNGVPCFIEGTLAFDVMIYETDVDKAKALLATNRPELRNFRTVWDYLDSARRP